MEKSIAIYLRTSTDEQNPENQLKDCLALNKWPEFREPIKFIDQESAWKDIGRSDFERLKVLIKARKISHLIVWDLDRLYRNRKKLIEFFKFSKVYGCKIHSSRQGWLEQLNDIPEPWNEILYDFMLQIMGWMAEDESNIKSKRIRASIRMKEDGAYSYKGNKWGRKTVSTFKRNKIKEMINDPVHYSIRQIARELNLSIGAVHKYIGKIKQEKPIIINSSQLTNL